MSGLVQVPLRRSDVPSESTSATLWLSTLGRRASWRKLLSVLSQRTAMSVLKRIKLLPVSDIAICSSGKCGSISWLTILTTSPAQLPHSTDCGPRMWRGPSWLIPRGRFIFSRAVNVTWNFTVPAARRRALLSFRIFAIQTIEYNLCRQAS